MRKSSFSPYILRIILLAVAFIIVILSAIYSNRLAHELSAEEQKRMEIWAEATHQLIEADSDTDIEFPLMIIENNTTIPVYVTDENGRYMMSRNVDLSDDAVEKSQDYYQRRVDNLKGKVEPIPVKINDGTTQYIYYEDSKLLTQLTYFPYINFALIFLFFVLALLLVFTVQEAQQDRVWAGLSKETAHQLGTPISSLNAWQEVLREEYPDDKMLPEMDKDIRRLSVIADRFSKVGSKPELEQAELLPIVRESVEYMRRRTSGRVDISLLAKSDEKYVVMLNSALMSWVVENLMRNAVDAMEGSGAITITLSGDNKHAMLDVSDTGKGISRRDWRRVFLPGYTTKERGWGIGLSLSRRIIHDYHHGRIYVLKSQPGVGTTFRIELKRCAFL